MIQPPPAMPIQKSSYTWGREHAFSFLNPQMKKLQWELQHPGQLSLMELFAPREFVNQGVILPLLLVAHQLWYLTIVLWWILMEKHVMKELGYHMHKISVY